MSEQRLGTPSGHRPYTPSYAGVEDPTSFAVDAPSMHFGEGSHDEQLHTASMLEPEPEQQQPVAREERAQGSAARTRWNPKGGMPRITKKAIILASGDSILFNSPRCRQALAESGVDSTTLLPRGLDEFALGAKLPAVVEKRWEAFEKQRRKNLALLLGRREQLLQDDEDEKESADDRGDLEMATTLKEEAEHKARIMQAAKLRMKEEQRAAVEAEKKKQERDEEQRLMTQKMLEVCVCARVRALAKHVASRSHREHGAAQGRARWRCSGAPCG
jgi:hypothetical protein